MNTELLEQGVWCLILLFVGYILVSGVVIQHDTRKRNKEVKAYFIPKSGGLYAITVKGRRVLVHEKRALYKRRKKNTGTVSVAL